MAQEDRQDFDSGEQAGFLALLREQGNSFLIEGKKGFAAQPGPLVGDQSVGKVTARVEDSHRRFNSRAVGRYIADVEQRLDGGRNIREWKAIHAAKYPYKLAEAGKCDGNGFRLFQQLGCGTGLLFIILDNRPDQNVGVDGDLHC